MSTLKGKHFISITDLSENELEELLQLSLDLKSKWTEDAASARAALPMRGMSMSMIFQKRSTRTRVSSETGIYRLGGHALMLGPQDIQLGVNETMEDTAKVLCRFNDILLARVFGHGDIVELAKYSSVPIINALSDKYHPLQTLADLMVLRQHFGDLKGKTLAWVGDGNNIIHDLMIGAIKQGMHVRVATPKGYECLPDVVATAQSLAQEKGVSLTFTHDPEEAVESSNVIATDTWISMGQEEEAKKRKADFAGYQVTSDLMGKGESDCVFIHCLPRKPEEVTDEVFYSDKSLVFPEAENRMWTVSCCFFRFYCVYCVYCFCSRLRDYLCDLCSLWHSLNHFYSVLPLSPHLPSLLLTAHR
jgi:ornithine carbamoyltransferase